MKLVINDTDLGELDDEMLEKVFKKYKTRDLPEIAIKYMKEIIKEDTDDMTVDEIIKKANFEKNCSGYKTIAELINIHMSSDLRPSNEVCKNCDSFHDGFCVNWLMEVNPFNKGNSCWSERQNRDNITHIAEGYVKYGKDMEPDDEPSESTPANFEKEEDNLIEFKRPRWAVKDDDPIEDMSIDDLRTMFAELEACDPKELHEELDREAAEYEEGLEISGDEKEIVKCNMNRFIEISGYLYSIWLTGRQHGLLSVRNVTETTADTNDDLIKYINDQTEAIVEGVFVDNLPEDPMDNDIESIMTAYSNYILGGISGGVNPNRIKAVVKCFVSESDYQTVMDRITEYTKKYFWLKEQDR